MGIDNIMPTRVKIGVLTVAVVSFIFSAIMFIQSYILSSAGLFIYSLLCLSILLSDRTREWMNNHPYYVLFIAIILFMLSASPPFYSN